MKLGLYSLLHLCEEETSVMNSSVKDFRDQIAVYLHCAVNLSNSLRSKGIDFTLLTNRKQYLDEIVNQAGMKLNVKDIPFCTQVPPAVKFYSAHFKLDAFRYLSTLNDDYVGLCDLDMVCINNAPPCFLHNAKHSIPMCYDISDMVIPAYGHEVVIRDLELIHGVESEGRWSGGEFITGAPQFFRTLMEEIDSMYDNYLKNVGNLRHVGDEVITSAALENIRKKGIYVADAGTLGIVGRFWNAKTRHHQKPFEYFQQSFLLHLPSDKRFLAGMAQWEEIRLSGFLNKYNSYRRKTKIKSFIRRIV